jgi:hypothetical protein
MGNIDESDPQRPRPEGKLFASDQPNVGPLEYRALDQPNVGPLEYQTTYRNDNYEIPRRWHQHPGSLFVGGIISGTTVSAILWIAGGKVTLNGDFGVCFLLSVLFVKLVGGAYFISISRWRPLGAGLLASLALGCMIFGVGSLVECGRQFNGK